MKISQKKIFFVSNPVNFFPPQPITQNLHKIPEKNFDKKNTIFDKNLIFFDQKFKFFGYFGENFRKVFFSWAT